MSRFPARRCIKEYKTILFRKKKTSAGGNHPGRPGNFHPNICANHYHLWRAGCGDGPRPDLEHCSKWRGDRIFLRHQQRGSLLRARSGCGRVGLTQILPDSNSWPTDAAT